MAPASVDPNALVNHTAQDVTQLVSVRSDREYPQSERRLKPGWPNSYWQTEVPHMVGMDETRYYLKKRGFYYKKTEKFARLKVLAKRCARGHRSYDAYSVRDLKTLIRSRGLKWQAPSKKNLVQCLEAADDADDAKDAMNATKKLPRFSELPPELRNRVYVLYFESLGEVPPRFVLPPLCRASRQLRLETTGLFFEHSTFIV
jgi:hypothetical protein